MRSSSNVIPKVVENAPGLGHTGCGDDHRGALEAVQANRLFSRADELCSLESEDLAVLLQECARLDVEALGMEFEDLRHVDCERRVDEHGDRRQPPRPSKLVERVDQLLCPAYGEGRHDDLPAALYGFLDDALEVVMHLLNGPVDPVAVRALHDDVVDRRRRVLGVADDRQPFAAEVSSEDEASYLATFLHVEHDLSRTQNVTGIQEASCNAR